MTWNCSCGLNWVNLVTQCQYCKTKRGTFEPFDSIDEALSGIRLDKIDRSIHLYLSKDWKDNPMTPQEQLFSDLFNHEKLLVKDMDTLALRAHREELAHIAFEARARLTAVDDEEKTRRNKSNNGKPRGFETSINIDEASTNAINTIRERQNKLSKKEKMLKGLADMYQLSGMSLVEAQKLAEQQMTAGAILGRIKDKASQDIITGKNEPQEPKKPIINPFEKK